MQYVFLKILYNSTVNGLLSKNVGRELKTNYFLKDFILYQLKSNLNYVIKVQWSYIRKCEMNNFENCNLIWVTIKNAALH